MQPSNFDPHGQPWWRARLSSFRYAFNGLWLLVTTQVHAQFHLLATVCVLAFGWWVSFSVLEWSLLILAIGAVWAAEAMNTAIEFLVDLVHPQWHQQAGQIKDLAAAAVLLSSIAAAAVGILLFGTRLYERGYLPWFG